MRKLILSLLALVTALAGVPVMPAAPVAAHVSPSPAEGANVSVARYGGADRYDTSLQVAEAVAADAGGVLSSVVLVSGRRWTDAVVAAPIAGSFGAPVLMTPPDELRADALEFLQRTGVSTVMVVGPDASGGAHGPGRGVGDEVLEALEDAGIYVERVAGDSRFGTGVAAAQRVTPGAMGNRGPTAVIASSEVFADALVAGPFAARGIHPVLLTSPSELHTDVAAYLDRADVAHVVLMGGTAALSEEVEWAVTDLGIDVTRVAGRSRYDTAVKAAELVTGQYNGQYGDTTGRTCFDTEAIGVARARVPFDSFSAAPLLARLCAPLVLADPGEIPADTADFLDAATESHGAVTLQVFGGDAAVSQAAIDAYLTGTEPTDESDEAGQDTDADDSDDSDQDKDADSTADAISANNLGELPPGTCGGHIDDEPKQIERSVYATYPAWSPDCQHIVFARFGALWIGRTDGTVSQRLVNNGGDPRSAVWSPAGDRIAYVSGGPGQGGNRTSYIWTVNVDGTNNVQLTRGDVVDLWPTWSPDGKHIAFERVSGSGSGIDGRIVVMTASGTDLRQLNEGRPWERSPAWSPDGTRLAYVSDGVVVVSDTDGANAQRVYAGVHYDGGLSWSPDGQRLVLVRDDRASVAIVDVDGSNEKVVYDEGRATSAPRWSPDGQLILFHATSSSGDKWLYVTGAGPTPVGEPGDVIPVAEDCRPRGLRGTTAGFPLPNWAPSAVGTVRIGVLFMDFPDAQAAHTTQEEAAFGLQWAEEYLEAVSYGKLDVEFVPLHSWLRAEQESTEFIGSTPLADALVSGASAHAVALADDEIDFSTLDMVLTVFPSSHFANGNAGGMAEADGVTISTTRVNTTPLAEPRRRAGWSAIAAHEITHVFGLADLYIGRSSRSWPETPSGQMWFGVRWGLMVMRSYHPVPKDDTGPRTSPWMLEMLAWSRWQLGWLDASQIHCDSGAGATVTLAPIAQPGGGVAMAAVPLSRYEVIVVESRRDSGYDGGISRSEYMNEGVLVYTVNSLVESGDQPLRVAGDSGDGVTSRFPVFGVGESVTVRGYTITVTADDGNTHTVTITPAN